MTPTQPVHLLLLVVAIVLAGVSAWQSTSPYWNRFVSLALMAWFAAALF